MAAPDLAPVIAIERASLSSGWSDAAFEADLTRNAMSRYIVLEVDGEIVGFGGIWLMVDEAHVITVAVAPPQRRRGFGLLLVHGLVDLARRSGMSAATLECRVSNAAARALYKEYGFYEVGLRKKYYSDNQEDAVIMTTEQLDSPAYQERFRRLEARLAERLPGVTPYVPVDGPAA
jgi:ribosomal-protein-alanine N-acetyltransferase